MSEFWAYTFVIVGPIAVTWLVLFAAARFIGRD